MQTLQTSSGIDNLPFSRARNYGQSQDDIKRLLSKGKKEISNRVFVNRSVHLDKIGFYGFDMDYTLAEYKSPEFEILLFNEIKKYIISMGYPQEIMEYDYDPKFAVRGLWFDNYYGNLLKVDAYGNILVCVHGFEFLKQQEVSKLYPNKFIANHSPRIFVFYTLYDLPVLYILACLVDFFSNSPQFTQCETGVKSKDLMMSYTSIFQDVRAATDYIHAYGNFKVNIIENLEKYLKKDPRLPLFLARIAESGAQTFLLTNSDYNYTNTILTYLFDFPHGPRPEDPHRNWITYFDSVVVDAKKPIFFDEGTVLRQVDTNTGSLLIGIHTGPLQKNQVYAGGSCEVFSELVGATGKDVLYVGDHIFGDILKSKKIRGWRTFLIIPELMKELRVWTKEFHLFSELQSLDAQLGRMYLNLDSSSKTKPDVSKIRSETRKLAHKMDMSYSLLGSTFRSGSRQSYFATQVVRFADLYAASTLSLLYYPFSYMFRAPPMLLPHETTVAHNLDLYVYNQPVDQITETDEIVEPRFSQRKKTIPHLRPEKPLRLTHIYEEEVLDEDSVEKMPALISKDIFATEHSEKRDEEKATSSESKPILVKNKKIAEDNDHPYQNTSTVEFDPIKKIVLFSNESITDDKMVVSYSKRNNSITITEQPTIQKDLDSEKSKDAVLVQIHQDKSNLLPAKCSAKNLEANNETNCSCRIPKTNPKE